MKLHDPLRIRSQHRGAPTGTSRGHLAPRRVALYVPMEDQPDRAYFKNNVGSRNDGQLGNTWQSLLDLHSVLQSLVRNHLVV